MKSFVLFIVGQNRLNRFRDVQIKDDIDQLSRLWGHLPKKYYALENININAVIIVVRLNDMCLLA